jgi:hypothetical protein
MISANVACEWHEMENALTSRKARVCFGDGNSLKDGRMLSTIEMHLLVGC